MYYNILTNLLNIKITSLIFQTQLFYAILTQTCPYWKVLDKEKKTIDIKYLPIAFNVDCFLLAK